MRALFSSRPGILGSKAAVFTSYYSCAVSDCWLEFAWDCSWLSTVVSTSRPWYVREQPERNLNQVNDPWVMLCCRSAVVQWTQLGLVQRLKLFCLIWCGEALHTPCLEEPDQRPLRQRYPLRRSTTSTIRIACSINHYSIHVCCSSHSWACAILF